MSNYTTGQVAKIVDMTIRNVQFYTDRSVVVPEFSHSGKGRHRRYSLNNIYQLAIVNELSKYGIPIGLISGTMELCKGFADSHYGGLDKLAEKHQTSARCDYVLCIYPIEYAELWDIESCDHGLIGGGESKTHQVRLYESANFAMPCTSTLFIHLNFLFKSLNIE